jgi:protein-L-isoaspartate(D-aspartate) O-methyltransferase
LSQNAVQVFSQFYKMYPLHTFFTHQKPNVSSKLRKSMLSSFTSSDIKTIANASIPLRDLSDNGYSKIRDLIGDARVVLIGEETHGTQEFYKTRAEITRALIEHEGFSLVLCEGVLFFPCIDCCMSLIRISVFNTDYPVLADFPPFYALNRFVGGTHPVRHVQAMLRTQSTQIQQQQQRGTTPPPEPESLQEAMDHLKGRFPVWMWRNEVLRDFALWLKGINIKKSESNAEVPVSLLGMDIYSLFSSADEVIQYLEDVDPDMAEVAKERYGTLGSYRPDESDYAQAVMMGRAESQDVKVARMLTDLLKKELEYVSVKGDGDEFFDAAEVSWGWDVHHGPLQNFQMAFYYISIVFCS